MRVILLFTLVIAAALAAPAPPLLIDPTPPPSGSVFVKSYFFENYPNGAYKFNFELSDGTSREEVGEVKNEGLENQYISVKGFYSYNGPDKVLYRVNYESGVDGYKPEIEEGPGGAVPPDVAASLLAG